MALVLIMGDAGLGLDFLAAYRAGKDPSPEGDDQLGSCSLELLGKLGPG